MTSPPDLPHVEWRGERVPRVILGAAQLGMNYGIANTTGRPGPDTVRAIVQTAWESGITHFDTAPAYGASESALGAAMHDLGIATKACVTSKIELTREPREVAASIETTLEQLRVDRLWCLMLHHPDHIEFWDVCGEILETLRAEGRARHLGVSLSPLKDAPRCIEHPALDVLQIPCNAWDTRPLRLGIFDAARDADKLCCVRSVYLQGLLTMPRERAAAMLPPAAAAARAWHKFAADARLDPKEAAVRFGMALGAPLVIGAETAAQLRETLEFARRGQLGPESIEAMAAAIDPVINDKILEPWKWRER